MSKKWILSDFHFGHKSILKNSGPLRGGTTPEEHDDWLIHQINSTVKKCDVLYVLGDVAFDYESLKKMKRIKAGNRILVRGNHDLESTQKYLEFFSTVHGMISFKGVFWLTHCPIHPQELRGRINIHGHVHKQSILSQDGTPDPRYINACVEMTYGVPQDLDALLVKHKDAVIAERNKQWNESKNKPSEE